MHVLLKNCKHIRKFGVWCVYNKIISISQHKKGAYEALHICSPGELGTRQLELETLEMQPFSSDVYASRVSRDSVSKREAKAVREMCVQL